MFQELSIVKGYTLDSTNVEYSIISDSSTVEHSTRVCWSLFSNWFAQMHNLYV